jgi:hypothetical protein
MSNPETEKDKESDGKGSGPTPWGAKIEMP